MQSLDPTLAGQVEALLERLHMAEDVSGIKTITALLRMVPPAPASRAILQPLKRCMPRVDRLYTWSIPVGTLMGLAEILPATVRGIPLNVEKPGLRATCCGHFVGSRRIDLEFTRDGEGLVSQPEFPFRIQDLTLDPEQKNITLKGRFDKFARTAPIVGALQLNLTLSCSDFAASVALGVDVKFEKPKRVPANRIDKRRRCL